MSNNEATPIEVEFTNVALALIEESAIDLFDSYGCQLTQADTLTETSSADAIASAIGFTGTHARGVLAITIDGALANKLNPLGKDSPIHAQGDWIGELANQLLGRVKNRFLTYSVELAMSTPVVVQGSHLKVGGMHDRSERRSFTSDGRQLCVWWHSEVDPALVLSQEDAPEVQGEGEMVLF